VTDNVVPFARPSRKQLPPGERALHRRAQQARPGARALAAEQAAEHRARYDAAVSAQEEERLLRDGRPVPARITIALDAGGHEGPDVDTACGAVEPAVDLWECGIEVPTGEQMRLLSKLTGFPIPWFYKPLPAGPLGPGLWICWGGRRGCESPAPDVVDDQGVLHYGGEPRVPPQNVQSGLW